MLRRWPPAPRDCIVITVAAPLGWADSSTTLADSTRTGMKSYVYASGVENWCYPSGPRDGGALAAAAALRYALAGRFLFFCCLFDDGCALGLRGHRAPDEAPGFSWPGCRPCVRRAAAGSGRGRRGAAERRPCSDSPSLAATRACRCVLLYFGLHNHPYGFLLSSASRAPLGEFPKYI